MTIRKSIGKRLPWWGWGLLAGMLVLLVGGVIVWKWTRTGGGAAANLLTFTVERGPLTISVAESGTIRAREQVIIKSEVEGQTTIIYLIEEGKLVKEGELLVELDASTLQDNRIDQLIQVQNAEAALIGAEETLAVAKSQAESDIAKAKLDYRFAQEDVTQYQEGEYKNQLMEARSNITLAKEELERATEKYKWSETLFAEKYISQTELEADRLTKNRAELNHELAVANLNLLENFTYKRTLDQLQSDVEQARMALDRVNRKAQADIKQAEADLKAKQMEYDQQKGKLDKIDQQIEKTKIRAPIDGMVIYATSAKGNWRGNQEPLDEGQVVREREELIYLPTADAMMAEIKVHESNLDKVRLGLPATVTVDAVPGRTFRGEVASIAPLPDAQSMFLNPDLKVYTTLIHLEGNERGLRTGMSCRAEILVEHFTDVVYVPMHCVLRIDNQPHVHIYKNGQVDARPVKIGLNNNRMVQIVSGLEAGEQVLHGPPLAAAAAPSAATPPGGDAGEGRSRPPRGAASAGGRGGGP
ncbi:MAG: efflux RND transporter periplasmic adaptor subunit [Phycisphaerales bacterium]|nr:efflux RND transporter periplasmic adaptor subunit [Phycisphaerales bacterium]